jgi:hypothetical protein
MYVVAEATIEGLLHFSSGGEFIGFFGSNLVSPNLAELFLRNFLTREQRARRSVFVPIEYSNVFMDSQNFLYTTTVMTQTGQVKRLNYSGRDILSRERRGVVMMGWRDRYGDMSWNPHPNMVDVTVDEWGTMTALDNVRGRLYQYNQQGMLMFIMGGRGDALGLFSNAAAVAQFEGRLFVLDSATAEVTTFVRNEFGRLVHEANNAFFAGDYDTSTERWREVMKRNTNYTPAYVGLGNDAFRKKDYRAAMAYYKEARAMQQYSQAFKEIRNQWMRDNFSLYMTGIVALILLTIFTKKHRKVFYRKVRRYFYLDEHDLGVDL